MTIMNQGKQPGDLGVRWGLARIMTDLKDGTFIPPHAVSPQVQNIPRIAPPLILYQHGAVGLLQWVASAHPQIFRRLQKDHPELLKAAASMGTRKVALPVCPGGQGLQGLQCAPDQLSGLSALGSWYDTALNYLGKTVNLYGAYTAIKNGQTTQDIKNQIAKQVALAAQGKQPANIGRASSTPPAAQTVTQPAPSHIGAVGVLAIGGGLGAVYLLMRGKGGK